MIFSASKGGWGQRHQSEAHGAWYHAPCLLRPKNNSKNHTKTHKK